MNQITNIIQALQALGVSQQDMANASGLTQGRISQLSNKGACTYEAGKKLAELLEKEQQKEARRLKNEAQS